MNKQCCFIVTSVIQPWTEQKLNYGDTRSAFSYKERYTQTIATIDSIRKYAPNADIIIIEAGRSTYNEQLRKLGVRVVNVGRKPWVRRAVSSSSKAWGEAMIMVAIWWRLVFGRYDYYYKISGRYRLNEQFNEKLWSRKQISGKDIYGDKHEISTRLLGIPKCQLWRFYKAIFRRFWKLPITNVYESYILKGIDPKNVCWLDVIGVEGEIGVNKVFISE